MDRQTSTLLFFATILVATAPAACGGAAGNTSASDGGGGATAGTGGGGAAGGAGGGGASPSGGQGGATPSACAIDALTAQPWGADDDACTVQGDLIICSTYKFRFDGTWQKETLISDSNGVSGTCTQGSWSQRSCGVLELDDCAHAGKQLTWAVAGTGASAVATLDGRHYSAEAPEFAHDYFSDCVPAACPDAPKNTDAFVGTWAVTKNDVTVTCNGGLAKPTVGDFVWQKGTSSDLEEPDGSCTWRLDVLASTFSLPSSEVCTPATGVTFTYYRYDGELDSPTAATLSVGATILAAASATSPAGACSLIGTLMLAKVSTP